MVPLPLSWYIFISQLPSVARYMHLLLGISFSWTHKHVFESIAALSPRYYLTLLRQRSSHITSPYIELVKTFEGHNYQFSNTLTNTRNKSVLSEQQTYENWNNCGNGCYDAIGPEYSAGDESFKRVPTGSLGNLRGYYLMVAWHI